MRLALDESGAVAIKVAHSPEDVVALHYEIDLLRQATHPGLVTVLDDVDPAPPEPELRTRYAGEPLNRWRGDLAGAVGLGAAIAATLADLHGMRLVHGRIDTSHVLVGADGRPRLCGFAPATDRLPQDDVAALARLISELIDRAGSIEPRWPLPRRGFGAADRRAVADILRRASDVDPDRRPSARSVATALLAAVPGAQLRPATRLPTRGELIEPAIANGEADSSVEDDPVFGNQTTAELEEIFGDRPWPTPTPPVERPSVGGRPSAPPPSRRRRAGSRATRKPRARRRATTTALLGLTLVAGGAAVLYVARPLPAARGTLASADPEPPVSCDGAQVDPPSGPSAVTSADVDGDGCADQVRVDNGLVEAAGQRWQVGTADDSVTVADWDCDGTATPAIYRPATGDVFVFPTWASLDHPVAVTATGRVVGGRRLTSTAPTAEACPQLAVEMPSGEHRVVEVDR